MCFDAGAGSNLRGGSGGRSRLLPRSGNGKVNLEKKVQSGVSCGSSRMNHVTVPHLNFMKHFSFSKGCRPMPMSCVQWRAEIMHRELFNITRTRCKYFQSLCSPIAMLK
ncbi:hypothetical protein BS78_04G038800 [Paspalum vaginatum]|nr:hypothetical protein BS78_04G038800 [Paspalum vaginatum]